MLIIHSGQKVVSSISGGAGRSVRWVVSPVRPPRNPMQSDQRSSDLITRSTVNAKIEQENTWNDRMKSQQTNTREIRMSIELLLIAADAVVFDVDCQIVDIRFAIENRDNKYVASFDYETH